MHLSLRPSQNLSGLFCNIKTLFRIRMDPSFFADPDPDFKNPDTDSSVFAFHIFNNLSDSEKKFDPDPDKRTRIRNTDSCSSHVLYLNIPYFNS